MAAEPSYDCSQLQPMIAENDKDDWLSRATGAEGAFSFRQLESQVGCSRAHAVCFTGKQPDCDCWRDLRGDHEDQSDLLRQRWVDQD